MTGRVPLRELGTVVSGATPKTGRPEYWDGEIPWVTPADLSKNEGIYFHGSPKKITQAGFDSCSAPMLPAGAILFSSRAPIGHCALTAYPLCTNQGFKSLIPNERLHPLFGYFAIKFITPIIVAKGRGATFDEINKEMMEEVEVPYFSLPDQRRIAGLLKESDRLRRMRQYALELDETFLHSLFLEIFGDPVRDPHSFPRVEASTLYDIKLGKMLDEKRFTGRHLRPYLGNANVQWDSFDLTSVKEMDFPGEDFDRFRLLPGDLLVCEGGEVGRTAIWRGTIADCCYQKALHRLRPLGNDVLPEYFLYYMRVVVQGGLLARVSSTSTITHFTAEKFEELPVMVPPMKLQRRFAQAYHSFHRLNRQHHEAVRQAEHLFQSLLQQAFSPAAKEAVPA